MNYMVTTFLEIKVTEEDSSFIVIVGILQKTISFWIQCYNPLSTFW